MRATWRVMSAISIPQASGSSNARRSDTCKAPSTTTARRTSNPPNSIAAGGTRSASKAGGAFSDAIGSPVAHCLHGVHHFSDRGQCKLFEVGGIGHRHVLASDAQHRRIEPVKGLFGHACRDLGADSRLPPAFFDRHEAVRLLDR